MPMSESPLEQKFMNLWLEYWPELDLYREYQVSKARRYRADFCCPKSRVVIEIQGGYGCQSQAITLGLVLLVTAKKPAFML